MVSYHERGIPFAYRDAKGRVDLFPTASSRSAALKDQGYEGQRYRYCCHASHFSSSGVACATPEITLEV
jgi:hypothetical protein